ncbi:MAG: transcription factor jumonji jmjC domain-containing protein [Oscillatoriales cyanobacterium]|jgi:ribosomal protein L16 Arg81 hydroxylase|nr:MAG: transcription factor jumonji jmjC domain-containing protein [Oscillatoriales cyanobacterium]
MNVLSTLLYPYSPSDFLVENWTKRAVFIPGNTSDKFQHLFNWNQLNHLLNYHQIRHPDLRFSQDGESLPVTKPENWLDRLQQGATLIINGVHHRVPELEELVANIRQEMGHRSQINLYCSSSAQQGFDCHYDSHEVLILQIDGQKEWFVFPETIAAPVSTMRSADQIPPDVPPYLQCRLKPGDLLYIPRGHWHYAIASGDPADETYVPSLHLTLGITCQTGLDWLSWLQEELQDSPAWRENLPVIPDEIATDARSHLEQLRDRLISWLHTPDAIDHYLDTLSRSDHPRLPFALPTQMGSQMFEHGFETRFVRSKLHPVKITELHTNETQICIAAKQATIKGISTDLVTKIFRPEGFSLLDLADWSPSLDLETEVIPLLNRLVKQGLLLVYPPTESTP